MVQQFIPSKYQQAVYDFIVNGNGNAVIDAVAGSGKSTTIINAIKLIPVNKTVLFLAFNKAIVDELKIKIGQVPNVEIMTLHSLGCKAVNKTFKSILDNNKYKSYLNDAMKFGSIKPNIELEDGECAEYKQNIIKLIDLYRAYLINSPDELYSIADKYQMNIIDNEIEMAINVVNWGKNETHKIDFTDMIYFPNIKKINIQQYDFILIDECQDLNTAQRNLFLKAISPNGRFIAVGDPRQAIYGFAGADVESFRILQNLPNTQLFPLSVCYRCAKDIINLAKTIVPQIEANENAINGQIDNEAKLIHITDGDMVLCRNTAPIVQLCIQYIANGTKAYVKGKDIGMNLINLIKKTNRKYIEDAIEKLTIESEKLLSKISKRSHCTINEAKEDNAYLIYIDKVRAIEIIGNGLKTTDAVCNRIEIIFKEDERSGICLSTIHKAKGLESNNVYIICKDKLLPKRNMKIPWMAEQEFNLTYVAYTRAKIKLGFVVDFDFK